MARPAMITLKDIVGKKFGLLSVLEMPLERAKGLRFATCICECGKTTKVSVGNLISHVTRSCGCLRLRINIVHGHSMNGGSSEYRSWESMRSRCEDKFHPHYNNYGGRGIVVCNRWRHSFADFLSDMGPKPSPSHTIDRFQNANGNYEPGNCRWATRIEQNRNRKNNSLITCRGRTMCIAEWAEELGVPAARISTRLRRGWSPEQALIKGILK